MNKIILTVTLHINKVKLCRLFLQTGIGIEVKPVGHSMRLI